MMKVESKSGAGSLANNIPSKNDENYYFLSPLKLFLSIIHIYIDNHILYNVNIQSSSSAGKETFGNGKRGKGNS